MSGADYFGGCQHRAKEPCAACREANARFAALFRSLPGRGEFRRVTAPACEPTRGDVAPEAAPEREPITSLPNHEGTIE